MVSARVQLVALLIATLLCGAAQCMATCATDSFKPAAPPCHQRQAPSHELAASCGHDFLVPDAHRSPAANWIAIGEPGLTLRITPRFVAVESVPFQNFSPPSGILRI
jgi:hypothetical protein